MLCFVRGGTCIEPSMVGQTNEHWSCFLHQSLPIDWQDHAVEQWSGLLRCLRTAGPVPGRLDVSDHYPTPATRSFPSVELLDPSVSCL